VAIIGTAQSWKRTPWKDDTLEKWGLNDAYQLPGWGTCTRWYDMHPLNRFFMPELHIPGFTQRNPRQIFAHELPPGHYVRPAHHLEWLSKQTFPVYLSRPEDHTPAEHYTLPTWPNVRIFPKSEIEARFGKYEASSPTWMLLHAVLEGYTEIHVYGIHLATEFEYVQQRPNFEAALGAFLGMDPRTETVQDGLRIYETAKVKLVLPVESPIFQAKYQYAFQPKPEAHVAPLQWELHKAVVKHKRAVAELSAAPRWKRKAAQDAVLRYEVLIADYQQQIGRCQFAASLR
jgi:hypothetical protein